MAPIIEASLIDITPPQITVSGIPESAILGSTTTIFFSAADTDAGVASIRATLNGVPIENGDAATFSKEGNNVFRVDAMDKAGNPSSKEMDFTVSAPERPTETSFFPIADTYIDGDAADINYGNSAILRLRSRGKDRALIKFDRSSILETLGSSTVVSATLTFAVAKNWENWAHAGSLALYRMTSPWAENDATWNTESSTSGPLWAPESSATAVVSNDTTSTVSFAVTADMQTLLDDAENDDWILKKVDECAPGVIDLGSRESGTPPMLTVVYE